MFNGRLGAEYPFWNAGWGRQPIFSDRVTEGRRSVHDPRLGMVVGIQPEPFRRFLKRRGVEAHDSGFTARYLIAVPPSTKGFRMISDINRWKDVKVGGEQAMVVRNWLEISLSVRCPYANPYTRWCGTTGGLTLLPARSPIPGSSSTYFASGVE